MGGGSKPDFKKGSKFPDLTGDGKVTFADIFKRWLIKRKKKNHNGLEKVYMQTYMLKRKRGGKMRKKGAKGAPKASDFKRAKQTARNND